MPAPPPPGAASVTAGGHVGSRPGGGGALWAGIAQNVKKPPLTVKVILNFLVLMYPYGSLGVPLFPKSHDTLVELLRFTKYVERNKVHYAPLLRFH